MATGRPCPGPCPETNGVRGTPAHCATCREDRVCVAVASDPRRPEAGRWIVCGPCRHGWRRVGPGERQGLRYYDDMRAAVAS